MAAHFLLRLNQLLMGALNVNSLQAGVAHSLSMNTTVIPIARFSYNLRHVTAASSQPRSPSGTVEVTYGYALSYYQTTTHVNIDNHFFLIRSE